jgi:hypothetical protein
MILAKASIVNHDSRIIICSFIVLVTVITIVNYNSKTSIVQATVLKNRRKINLTHAWCPDLWERFLI